MGIYNTFTYNDGTLYGVQSKIDYVVEPFTATVVDYGRVDLSWLYPGGTVFGFRIVRNQNGYAEHEEDGIVIYETVGEAPGVVSFSDLDGDVPLTPGLFAYYTIWVRRADYTWFPAGKTVCLIPVAHNVVSPEGVVLTTSDEKFASLVPRVYTTAAQSYLDELDKTSDLYQFLSGMAVSVDEMLTFADLLVPDPSNQDLNPNVISTYAAQLGFSLSPAESSQAQKRLIRDAFILSKTKGTYKGVKTFVADFTGYPTEINTTTVNKMLSLQDSTFYNGIGNWIGSSGSTITANNSDVLPSLSEANAIDNLWVGKVVTTGTSIQNGNVNPILNGIIVEPGVSYNVSYYIQSPANVGGVTSGIHWYDYRGVEIGSGATGTSHNASSTFTKYSNNFTSPDGARYASLVFTFATAGTFYLDMIQVAETSVSANFYEASNIDIQVSPTKVNLIYNPSFEDVTPSGAVTDWFFNTSGSGGTLSRLATTVPGIYDGSNMVKFAGATGTTTIATVSERVDGDGFYTFSVYAKTGSGTSIPTLVMALVNDTNTDTLYDVNNQEIADIVTMTSTPISSDWVRLEHTMFIPKTWENSRISIQLQVPLTSQDVYFDCAQLELGFKPTDYFDGSYLTSGASWLGAENNSATVLYRNQGTKLGQVLSEAENYIPYNRAFTISTGITNQKTVVANGITS